MVRFAVIAAVLALTAGSSSAQILRNRVVAQPVCQSSQCYQAPYVAPVVQQQYVAPVYPAAVTYQPIAVYVVPGTPTAALNVYPGSLSVIQPVPVQINLNVTAPAASSPTTPGTTVVPAAPVLPSGR